MGGKLRTLRKVARKGFAKGLARGVFKKVALKLRIPKSLPNKGARALRQAAAGVQGEPQVLCQHRSFPCHHGRAGSDRTARGLVRA